MSFHPIPGRRLTRRDFLSSAMSGILAAGVFPYLPGCLRGRYDGPARHVILISLDTTRADHLGCYQNGWIQTPILDQVARESIVFANHLTPSTTTLASHCSLFTGRYPQHHGVPRNGFVLDDANPTLPALLKEAGFTTAGFLGSFALDSRFGVSRGIDTIDEKFTILVGDQGADQNQRRAPAVTGAVLDYLRQNGVPRNLFLFAHYFDPHQPYSPPPPFRELYRGETRFGLGDPLRGSPQGASLSPDETARARRNYAREVTALDQGLGPLFEELHDRKILDDALVVITSDHGEHLGDSSSGQPFDHGWTVYEPEVRVVCLVRLPGGQGGGTREAGLTSHVDLLPTIAAYLGLRPPAGLDGVALTLPGLPPPPERVLFSEATKPWAQVETDPRWYNLRKPRAARSGRYKYIQTLYRGTEELYDLEVDPEEKDDLLASSDREARSVADDLSARLASWSASTRPLPTRFESSQQQETIARLKSLGYL